MTDIDFDREQAVAQIKMEEVQRAHDREAELHRTSLEVASKICRGIEPANGSRDLGSIMFASQRVALIVLLSATFALRFVYPSEAQQCNLSGKTILYNVMLCLSTGCKNTHEKLTFLGDKIFSYEDAGNIGSIYYFDRTVDAKADPAQRDDAQTLRPIPSVGQHQVFLTESHMTDGLVLKDEEIFRNRTPPKPDLTVTTTKKIFTRGCNACTVNLLFEARFANGVGETKEALSTFCQIIQAQ